MSRYSGILGFAITDIASVHLVPGTLASIAVILIGIVLSFWPWAHKIAGKVTGIVTEEPRDSVIH